jgi:hypothetical protein
MERFTFRRCRLIKTVKKMVKLETGRDLEQCLVKNVDYAGSSYDLGKTMDEIERVKDDIEGDGVDPDIVIAKAVDMTIEGGDGHFTLYLFPHSKRGYAVSEMNKSEIYRMDLK